MTYRGNIRNQVIEELYAIPLGGKFVRTSHRWTIRYASTLWNFTSDATKEHSPPYSKPGFY